MGLGISTSEVFSDGYMLVTANKLAHTTYEHGGGIVWSFFVSSSAVYHACSTSSSLEGARAANYTILPMGVLHLALSVLDTEVLNSHFMWGGGGGQSPNLYCIDCTEVWESSAGWCFAVPGNIEERGNILHAFIQGTATIVRHCFS